MADESTKSPAPPEPPTPPTPPTAAADEPARDGLKGEVSRTDSPGAGVSAAPPGPPGPPPARRSRAAAVHRVAAVGNSRQRNAGQLLGRRLDNHRASGAPSRRGAPLARCARRVVRLLLGRDGHQLAIARRALRRCLLPLFGQASTSHSRQGQSGRVAAGAVDGGGVAGIEL